MTQLYRKVKVQDRYEDGSWARSYTESFVPVELPTREELARWYQENEDVCDAAFDEDDPCCKHRGWCYSFADSILELIERKMAA